MICAMKKRLLAGLTAAILCLSLAGCAGSSPKEDTSAPEDSTAVTIVEGETAVIDGVCEFTVDSVDITQKPQHYFEAEDGKAYVDVRIAFQNTSDESVSSHYIAEGLLVYAGAYEYTGITQAEENDEGELTNTYGRTVHPSETEYLHYLFSVPQEVQDSGNRLALNLTMCDHAYRMIIRDGAEVSDPTKKDVGDKSQTSEEIADGEVTVTDHGEFCVDYAQVTDRIIPTEAGGAYAYYAANDGEVFLDICVAYKNTDTEDVSVTKALSATLELSDESTFKAAHMSESGGRKTLAPDNPDIIPLETRYMHCVFSIPETAVNGETAEITFQAGKNKYRYSFTLS